MLVYLQSKKTPRFFSYLTISRKHFERVSFWGFSSWYSYINYEVSISCSREINRNGGLVKYRAMAADKHVLKKALRPKAYKLRKFRPISKLVEAKLLDDWSPEKISGWLKITPNKSPEIQVSNETIYKTLFIPCLEVFDIKALTYIRSKIKLRYGKRLIKKGICKGVIDAKTIQERPIEIEGRTTLGHWGGDLASGSHNSHITTLVDRKPRCTVVFQVNGKGTRKCS